MKNYISIRYSLLIFTVIAISSCTSDTLNDIGPESTSPNAVVSYEGDVKAIIDGNCISCHGATNPRAGLSLTNYEQVRNATENGSLLDRIQRQTGVQGVMPPSGRMPSANINIILAWEKGGFIEKGGSTDIASILSQMKLNSSTSFIRDITGKEFLDFPHGGQGLTADQTIRSVYSNLSTIPAENISTGNIVTKITYEKGANGEKEKHLVAFAMLKRESGYWPEGGDFEYVKIPFDNSNDYTANPFGNINNTNVMKGKLQSCVDCHKNAAGNDFLYINDKKISGELDQTKLNSSTEFLRDVTGKEFLDFPHGGQGLTADQTIRSVYSNLSTIPAGNISTGNIVSKITYEKGANGEKEKHLVAFAMLKREPGYWPEGGDFEYVKLPFDNSNNYTANPFGNLNNANVMKGKLQSCVDCHKNAAGNDFLYINDKGVVGQGLNQTKLNSSTKFLRDVTGKEFLDFPHGGQGLTSDQTIRSVYSNLSTIPAGNISTGNIISKIVYEKGSNGEKEKHLAAYAMLKRESGYWPEGGDFEYVRLPFDNSNDYVSNPFGDLNNANVMRGKLQGCVDCHKNAAGNDFLYINDKGVVGQGLNQTKLNSSTKFLRDVTGKEFLDFPHGGQGLTSDQTIRSVYSNLSTIPAGNISTGNIISKIVYEKGSNGEKEKHLAAYAMLKRESGYWPEGGDFEYVRLPFDNSNDYVSNPFGDLDNANVMKGKLQGCADCHKSAAGKDFLYINDKGVVDQGLNLKIGHDIFSDLSIISKDL